MARMILIAAVALGGMSVWLTAAAQQQGGAANQIAIDGDDIAGVITSARGPEAGVWVIAETTDTPTKLRKIVVTDDRGRYLLPDLPTKATFSIWVRGYGLVDSSAVRATPGRRVSLAAAVAPARIELARLRLEDVFVRIVAEGPHSEAASRALRASVTAPSEGALA